MIRIIGGVVGIVVLATACGRQKPGVKPSTVIPTEIFSMVEPGRRDSVPLSAVLTGNKYYVLIFVDGDCGGCVANLNGWKSFFDQTQDLLRPILVVSTGSVRTFESYYDLLGLTVPVLYDPTHVIRRANGWSADAVLIDEARRVLLSGSPITDRTVKRKYKQLIRTLPIRTD